MWRRLRLSLICVAAIAIVGATGLWVATRSWFLVVQIEPHLERTLGGIVHVGDAQYDWNGGFVLRDIVLWSPVHGGAAGEIGRISKAVVSVDRGKLRRGKIEVRELDIYNARLRFSEDANESGRFTFESLKADWADADTDKTKPPRVTIHHAELEYGVHDGDTYEVLGRRYVAGELHAAGDSSVGDAEAPWYQFILGEIDAEGAAREHGLTIRGRWNAATHEVSAFMDGLQLNEDTYNMCPQAVRAMWDHMELEGQIANARLHWDGHAGIAVAWNIMDVGLTLPVEAGSWARYHDGRIVQPSGRQRMQVYSGTIRLRGSELVLDNLIGELKSAPDGSGVPYKVTMRVPQLPLDAWQDVEDSEGFVAEAMRYTPFHVQFQLSDFRIESDETGATQAVDLPLQVAELLERFTFTDWTISTNIEISRDGPRVDAAGHLEGSEIAIKGDLVIEDASGSFYRFPYPFSDVDAYITFTQDGAKVERVIGTAPNGAVVHISGEIKPLGRYPEIDLRLIAHDAPVDELLRLAMSERYISIIDGLMHEPSTQKLQRAGLLLDEADVAELEAERRQLHGLIERGQADTTVMQRLMQVEAMLEAGVFELGGRVDLDLNIQRGLGPKARTQVSGAVTIDRVDAVVRFFPYPFSIRGGSVQWDRDGAVLIGRGDAAGLEIVTQNGGRGIISGQFTAERREDGSVRYWPELHIDVVDDWISELLYAAIATQKTQTGGDDGGVAGGADGVGDAKANPAEAFALGQSAQMLRAIGLAGPMHYRGQVYRGDSGKVDYDFHVNLQNGIAQPTAQLAEMLGSAGLIWPTGWRWDDVTAQVHVTRDVVELIELTGQRGDSAVAASVVLDVADADASLDVRFTDLPIGRYLVDLFPPERMAQANALWDAYEPTGLFNAHLQFHKRGNDLHTPRLFIEPVLISALIGEHRMTLAHQNGRLDVQGNTVTIRNLQMDLHRGAFNEGQLLLEGVLKAAANDRTLQLQGRWHDGRLESPLIGELLGLFKARGHRDVLTSLEAAGTFDARFAYGSGEAGRSYEVALKPREVTATVNGKQLNVQFGEQSTLRFVPERLYLEHISGAHDAGTFRLTGDVRLEGGVEATLEFDHAGALSSPVVQALLPGRVQHAVRETGFRDGPATRISDARLRLAQGASAASEGDQWHVDFHGRVSTDRAAIWAGIELKEIDGDFEVAVNVEPGHVPQVAINALVHRMLLLERELTNVEAANIRLSDDGRTLELQEARGDMYGGAVWGDTSIGVGEHEAYAANLTFVGVSLESLLGGTPEVQQAARNPGRGEVWGSVRLAGLRGQPETRSGRGSIRAVGSGLVNVPLVLQLAQLLQLTVPLRGDLDHADIVFYVDGERAVFERILLESTIGSMAALQLIGTGELDLRELELATQFRSRSSMLVIRDLVGGLSDQLYAIEVSGPLDKPRARIVPLPGLTQPERGRPQSAAAVLEEPTR